MSIDVRKTRNGHHNAIFTHNQQGPVRLLFPTVFQPQPVVINGKTQGDPIYSCLLLVSPEMFQPFADYAKAVAQAQFGSNLDNLAFPFKRGSDEKAKAEQKGKDGSAYEGMWVVKATSKYQPEVRDQNLELVPEIQSSRVYSGVYAYTELNFTTYDGVGANPDGVKAYLNKLMTLETGERLGGRTGKDAFADVASKTTNEAVDGSAPAAGGGGNGGGELPI